MYPCLIPGKHSASTRTPSFPLLSPRRIEGTPGAPGIGAARPAETRLRSPEHLTGNRGRLGDDREGSGTTVPPRRQGSASGALRGGGRAARGPLRCLLFWTPGPAVSGERTHVCESGLSGSMGEAGKTGHVCVRPCGPHLRARGKHGEGVTPRTPAP